MSDTVAVVLSVADLWLLQRVIRHEIAGQRGWAFPPASVELNDQIADAILLCETQKQPEAALRLSRGDLLALDYTVPADAKDVAGRPIGREILLKTFAARAELRGRFPDADQPAEPCTGAEARARLKDWSEDDGDERDANPC
jgi:hypothetical protein